MTNKHGGLAQMAREVGKAGRSGDTRLAHVNRDEERLLKAVGGAGTINPATGLPEYKFGLKKLKKAVKKVATAPIKAATKAVGAAVTAPLKGFSAVTGVKTKGLQKVVRAPTKFVGGKAGKLVGALSQMPLNAASGSVNLIRNPNKQLKQIGKETGRVATSKLLPIAASFVPGIGPGLAAGISAAQGGYAARKGGLGDILKSAAISGGTAYLGGKATQGLLGKVPGLESIYAPSIGDAASKAAGAGFNLGTGTGSILGSSGSLASSGLGQFAAPAAQGFNLGTGAGSLLGSAGLGLSQGALGAASMGTNVLPAVDGFGVKDAFKLTKLGNNIANQADPTAAGSPTQTQPAGQSYGGLGGLLGAGLGGFALSELLKSGQDYGNSQQSGAPVAPQRGQSSAGQGFDWDALRQYGQEQGLDPSQALSRNWDKIAGAQFRAPVEMARGGHARLVRGGGSGRDDVIDAKLSNGEYVLDAEIVALLGDGSTDAGAKRLDTMRKNIRAHKGQMLSRGKISPDAKSPLAYLKGVK